MAETIAGWRWNAQRERAAALDADGARSDDEIAATVGLRSRKTLGRWRRVPEYRARVAAIVARAGERAAGEAIANKEARLAVYQAEYEAIQAVIAARAVQYGDVPGGETGLLVGEPSIVKVYEAAAGAGAGGTDDEGAVVPLKEARVILVYKVDVPLLKERRETLKQAAIERREWVERSEQTSRPGLPGALDLAKLDDDELAALERLTAKATAGGGTPAGGSGDA